MLQLPASPSLATSIAQRCPAPAPWVLVSFGFHFTAGQAKAVAGLADYLARTGVPVHLVGHTFDARLAARPGVTVHKVPAVRGADVVGNVLVSWVGRAVARRVTRSHPAARVVVNGGNCVWADVNWVHYSHRAWQSDLSGAPHWFRVKEKMVVGWYRRMERVAYRAARLVLTNSRRTTADVIRCGGVAADRVQTIYYGADPAWGPPNAEERRRARTSFGLYPERPVITFVGGFGYDNRKGFDTLLAAWGRLCQDPVWDGDLVLAGGGKATTAVARQLERQGLSARVRLLGFTDRVFDLLAGSDLLVSPVRYEPYGLNVQEAICRGVPALVSAVAGVAEEYGPELVPMLLPNPEDADDLVARLRQWRGDMAGWQARFRPLGNRLRSRAWDDMAREIVAAVEAIGPAPTGGRP
jgi:glycosyltransferase involved in cell wall biosynthesis